MIYDTIGNLRDYIAANTEGVVTCIVGNDDVAGYPAVRIIPEGDITITRGDDVHAYVGVDLTIELSGDRRNEHRLLWIWEHLVSAVHAFGGQEVRPLEATGQMRYDDNDTFVLSFDYRIQDIITKD